MKKKVLVVDDEKDARAFVASVLGDDYDVSEASSADEGIAAARADTPDLMILDVQMPGKDGFVMFDELGHDETLKGVPVVMLTGIAEKTGMKFSGEDMGQYIGSEPEAYIDKPIEPIVLKQAVKRLLKGQAPSA